MTARVEDIAAGGDGVALVDGARVFTPLTAPGDLAEIDVRGDRGALVALVEKGADRSEAPCRHYGACGGCALQHLSPDYYRRWKRRRVIEALAREGFDEASVAETIETPAASRRRAVFAVKKAGGELSFGFNARRSAEIAAIDSCLILHQGLSSRLPALRALAAKIEAREFDLAVTLCDNGLDIAISGKTKEPRGPALADLMAAASAANAVRLSMNGDTMALFAPPLVRFDGIPVTPPPGGFLQASREGEAALIALVMGAAAGAKKIADLFSGCGTFSLPLARAATVFAVDSDSGSIDALTKAAAGAQAAGLNINPVKAQTRDLYERPLGAKELKAFDAVIFDPPRAGAQAQALELAKSGVPTIIGVSCNPVTFARDAALLRDGGYTLSQTTPVDQFVYSPHVELVGVFRLQPGTRHAVVRA
ncbi:MAG: RNA methyltransferase [Pseudomonadota bacterium]